MFNEVDRRLIAVGLGMISNWLLQIRTFEVLAAPFLSSESCGVRPRAFGSCHRRPDT